MVFFAKSTIVNGQTLRNEKTCGSWQRHVISQQWNIDSIGNAEFNHDLGV